MPSLVDIDLLVTDERWLSLDPRALATPAVEAALKTAGHTKPAEISLLATDDAQMARLNADFRGKAVPTNVLSWPSEELSPSKEGQIPPPANNLELGDIALGYETCMAEARDMQKPPRDHVTHLIVHGVLHLLGYDHQTDADAALMERLETETLAKLGVPDPY